MMAAGRCCPSPRRDENNSTCSISARENRLQDSWMGAGAPRRDLCRRIWMGPRFEALVAEIVAQYANTHDPRRECCFIAELAGEPAGSAFVMQASAKVAKLRLLIVEPKARGRGIGRDLVEQSLNFARRAGYESMILWTQNVLKSARRIYAEAGFKLISSRRYRTWGVSMVGETWQRRL
jgi:GNAT superfamily N-acetyltransferase